MKQLKIKLLTGSVLRRLVILFFTVAFPVFATEAVLYYNAIQQLDKQVMYSLEQQLNYVLEEMEGQMTRIQIEISQLRRETDTVRLSSAPNMMDLYDRIMQINFIQERLYAIELNNPLIKNIVLYMPVLEKKILAVATDKNESVVQSIDKDEVLDAWKKALDCTYVVSSVGNDLLYADITPYPSKNLDGTQPKMIFLVQYDLDKIGDYLADVLPNISVQYILFDDEKNVILTNENDTEMQNVLNQIASGDTAVESIHTANLMGNPYFVLTDNASFMKTQFALYVSREEALASLEVYTNWIWLLFVLICTAAVAYCIYIFRNVHVPIRHLAAAFGQLEKGNMDVRVSMRGPGELNYLNKRFNETVQKLQTTIDQLYRQQIMMQQAQLKQMQAQINPHFLYNNFFILDNMIVMEDYENASNLCRKMGGYFRYVTRDGRSMVFLNEELEHAIDYIEIQNIRFGRRMKITYDELPESYENSKVPRLILQPILENAFVHSLNLNRPDEMLNLGISRDETYIIITIENSGEITPEKIAELQGMLDKKWTAERTGLINVHQRLLMTHGVGLTIRQRQDGGLIVILRLRRSGPIHDIPDYDSGR